jgi:TatD DNase family protein
MRLFDAHNHLHDPRLAAEREAILRELPAIGIQRIVVNGTREEDWPAVAALAGEVPCIIPSFGLHPWFVAARSADWLKSLTSLLDAHPGAGIGEIGLDRWVKDHDLAQQTEVFTAQLALAAQRNLPVSVHCLKAWGALWDILCTHPLPARGFLLHSYGGPAEMIDGFVSRGARFSFSAWFLHERKAAQREVFRRIPLDRVLVETDAPDMLPPAEHNAHPLSDPATGEPINHPANLQLAYTGLAELRGMPLEDLAAQVEQNLTELFPS